MKKALVCGAGGFIGNHLVNALKLKGYWTTGVDLKLPEFSTSCADEFVQGDLTDPILCNEVVGKGFDEVYQLAADMGGAGFIFTGENDAAILHNSASINLNILEACRIHRAGKVFFSSSACIYPDYNQLDPNNPKCSEDSVYPAQPDSEYGWEKLFSERVYLAYKKQYDLQVRIARFHNIFGELGCWEGGREKAPAALCRKVARCQPGDQIEIWGDGLQTRSFLYIGECLEGIFRLMESDFCGPVNIGSEEMVTINELAGRILSIAEKEADLRHLPGPLGVRGRNSDNALIKQTLGWSPNQSLDIGLAKTYHWIADQVKKKDQQ